MTWVFLAGDRGALTTITGPADDSYRNLLNLTNAFLLKAQAKLTDYFSINTTVSFSQPTLKWFRVLGYTIQLGMKVWFPIG